MISRMDVESPVRGDPKKDPSRRCMPTSEWPDADQRCWEECLRSGDVFDLGGAGAGWAPHTRSKIAKGYGRHLTWLSCVGLLTRDAQPGSRITKDTVSAYLTHLQLTTSPNTVIFRVQELYLATLAMFPAEDWSWIGDIERRLRQSERPVRNKRRRLVSSADLYQCGLDWMHLAETQERLQQRYRASRFRDGLLVSFLASRPLRRGNLAAIEIGRHLIATQSGYSLRFEAKETKGRQELEAPFPDALVEALERYLKCHRPLLLARRGRWNKQGRSTNALWISGDGSPMTQMAIYDQVARITKAHFGHVVNPHLFRDAAATMIASEDPERVLTISSILGHSSLRTAERHYDHAQSETSFRKLQENVSDIRTRRRKAKSTTVADGPSQSLTGFMQ